MNNFEKNLDLLSEKKLVVTPEMKAKIMSLQAKSKQETGQAMSWADAEAIVMKPMIDAQKAAQKAAAAAKRSSRPPRAPKEKVISRSKFEKMAKGAAQDFVADTVSDLKHKFPNASKQELRDMAIAELDQVAWDLAGSLMYNPEIDRFVRKHLGDWQRIDPAKVKSERVQEYIADYVMV